MTNTMNAALAVLGVSALRSLLLAGLAGLGLKIFRVKSTAVRLFVWRAVLCASLAMPFLGQLLPPLQVTTRPLFRAVTASPVEKQFQHRPAATSSPNLPVATSTLTDVSANPPSRAEIQYAAQVPARPTVAIRWNDIRWSLWAALTYLGITFVLFVRYLIGLALSQRLVRASHEVVDPRLSFKLRSLCASAHLAESEMIAVPVTIGVFQRVILFPAGWREWDDSKLNAVLAHEASHVVRRDALIQHISLLHRAIFWFSPLAWWLDRHIAALSEQASDEAALSSGADRNDYARTLLTFFEAVQAAPGRIWWQGVSMAQHGQPEERLEKVLAWRGAISMNLKKSFAIAIVVLAIPLVYVIASARPSIRPGQEAQSTGAPSNQSPAAPSSTAPAMPAAPTGGVVSTVPESVAPVTSSVPEVPASSYTSRSDDAGYSYSYGYDDDDERFIIVSGKSDSYTMSGSRQDIRHVERLKKQVGGDFIWFQRDERSYIIRDQATIARARAFWAPQEELGKQQEALGKQQEELGKKQEALGKRMEEVRVNVPDMTAELDALKAKLQKLGPSATMEQVGDLQSEIGDLQSKIGELQSHAGEQQGKLGEEQGKLGEQQGRLGEQQGELGRRQGELAREASTKMKALLDEAIKNGKAQPEPDGSHGASL